jgi:uncharacterized membrane protein YkoI
MICDMKRRALLSVLLLSLATALPQTHAQDRPKETKEQKRARKAAEQAYAQAALRRGEILPMGRILELVREAVPGDLLELELDVGRLVYEATVLTATGQIRKLELDARTGAIIKVQAK